MSAAGREHARIKNGRTTSRLAAVQALYQIEFAGEDPHGVVEQFRRYRLKPGFGGPDWPDAEPQFFVDLVEGTWSRKPEIDGLISPALAQGWTLARIDPVLRAILRAGTYELLARGDVPARAAIDAYVDLSLEFDAGREVGFINSVLDRIAKGCRAPEMAERR
jgi:transcription antitermination protein NusB